MKSVGIITMHLPLSFGSALQAYALQQKIDEAGYNAEIIHYQYPNELHQQRKKGLKHFVKTSISFVLNALFGFPNLRKKNNFGRFYSKFYKLSAYYPTFDSLHKNPPKYDIYCTGSDQVWNPLYTKTDTSFLLSFVDDKATKFSYAASFAIGDIPGEYKDFYVKYLSQYQKISVRESSGINLVKELTEKDATLVCDPTILLTRNEWDIIADQTRIRITKPYILVFMLSDSFNPFPEVQHIIDTIQERLRIQVVYLNGGKRYYFRKDSKVIKTAGPSEFVDLIRHAEYVITSSFHATVFSSIYSRPFTSIVKRSHRDSRILSYLERVGMRNCALYYDSVEVPMSKTMATDKIDSFRDESNDFLKECLLNANN